MNVGPDGEGPAIGRLVTLGAARAPTLFQSLAQLRLQHCCSAVPASRRRQ